MLQVSEALHAQHATEDLLRQATAAASAMHDGGGGGGGGADADSAAEAAWLLEVQAEVASAVRAQALVEAELSALRASLVTREEQLEAVKQARMARAWHAHGTRMARAWHVHGTRMARALQGTCMVRAWARAWRVQGVTDQQRSVTVSIYAATNLCVCRRRRCRASLTSGRRWR